MSKHILDRGRRLKAQGPMGPIATVRRRVAGGAPTRRELEIARRIKGPANSGLRARAFLRIDRGYEA